MASLIGHGPRQYLVGGEDLRSFDQLKAALDGELHPTDPIERMWSDEIVDLEWDLHRLRKTRRAVVEVRLIDRLGEMAMSGQAAGGLSLGTPRTLSELKDASRGYLRGVPRATAFIQESIGFHVLDDELQTAQVAAMDTLLRLEAAILAASRQRDAILARLYGRREGIVDGRISSGRPR